MNPALSPQPKPLPLIPTSRDEDILKAIYKYRFATVQEITNLLYSRGSLTYVRSRLSRLAGGHDYADRSYLYRFPLPHSSIGNKERVYTLAAKGRELLESLGIPCDFSFQPAKVRNFSHSHIVHNILLARIAVYASVFCRSRPALTLDYHLSYDLSREKALLIPSSDGNGAKIAVVPDALFLFTRSPGERHQILFELDRGFEAKQKFVEHIKARIDLIQSKSYMQIFNERSIRIAYLTTGNTLLAAETRLSSMTAWTRELLQKMFPKNSSAWSKLFYFSSIDPDQIYQSELFTQNLWYHPDSSTIPVPLLDNL